MIFLFIAQVLAIITTILVIIYFVVASIDLLRYGPPFVKTRGRLVPAVIRALELTPESRLFDLGCGDGNILISALNHTPGIKGFGIEKKVLPYTLSRFKTFHTSLSIVFEDIFRADISQATHIYCYLSHEFMQKLEGKVFSECSKGTRIVSCDFPFPNLIPLDSWDISKNGDQLGKKLYIYKI